MDDRDLVNLYSDPTLTPAQKLQAIQAGSHPAVYTGTSAPEMVPTEPVPLSGIKSMSPITNAPAGVPNPSIAPAEPAIPGVTGVMGGVIGSSQAQADVQKDLNKIKAQKAAGTASGEPPLRYINLDRPGEPPLMIGKPRPAGGRSMGSSGAPAPWLQKYMAGQTPQEGKVVQPKTLTVQPLTKEGKAALDEADTEGFAAKKQQGEAAIQSQTDVADAAVRAANQQAMINAALAKREHERLEHLRNMEADYSTMADEVANTPITEPSMWGGEDAGHQILGRLALFLGTIGSGVSGQPNLVWQKMQSDIDRNLQVQKENKALKQSRLAAQGSLVDMARARFSDEATIDNSMRQAAYGKVAAQLAAYSEEAKTPERKAALDALMSEVNRSMTAEDEQRRQVMEQGELNERRAKAAMMARPDPLAQMVKRSGQLATIAKNERELQGRGPEQAKLYVPGVGYAIGEKEAQELRELKANHELGLRNLAKAEALMKKSSSKAGAFGVGSDDYHTAKALRTQLVTNVAKSYGGVIQQSDRDAAKEEVPDPSAWAGGQTQILDAARQKLESNFQAQIKAKTVPEAREVFTPKTEK